MNIIEAYDIKKEYVMGGYTVHALNGINVQVAQGDFISIMGPSGSGKSTLMNIFGCLDKPSSGTYMLSGINTTAFTRNELADIRNRKIGFIFQGFNLLQKYTAIQNVELPVIYQGLSIGKRKMLCGEALNRVGLSERMNHYPSEMSGGEQQRVAIARALVSSPDILLADEPTGNLDSKTGFEILSLLKELNINGVTIVLISHDRKIASNANRIIEMLDGKIHRQVNLKHKGGLI